MTCGISFAVRGWTGASIVVAVSPYGDTFAPSRDQMAAADVMDELVAWYDSGARAWSSAGSGWSAESDGAGRLTFRFLPGTPATSLTPNVTMQARLRLALAAGAPTGLSTGTCAATPGTVGWDRQDTETGSRSRSGSWRAAHRTTAHRRPSCELAMGLADAWAFTEAQRIAAHPFSAWIWDEYSLTYRPVRVGAIDLTPQRESPGRIEGTMQIWGVD